MTPPTIRRRTLLAVAVSIAAGLLVSGCGRDGAAVVVSLESPPRPVAGAASDDGPEATDATGEEIAAFCERLRELDRNPPPDDDPAATVEALLELADGAPADLADDFEVLAGAAEELSAVEDGSPDVIVAFFEVFLRPEVLEAGLAIDLFASEECGIDLDTNPGGMVDGLPGTTGPGPAPGGDGGIDLDDLDRIEAAAGAAGATWPDKVIGTSIVNETDVTLSATVDAPFTAVEALAACEAVRADLQSRVPALVVRVDNGESTVVVAPAGGACAPA